jgi:hypothetical protein
MTFIYRVPFKNVRSRELHGATYGATKGHPNIYLFVCSSFRLFVSKIEILYMAKRAQLYIYTELFNTLFQNFFITCMYTKIRNENM